MTNDQQLYCSYHPNRPTALRCNRCSRPICSSCAIRTPVGYRCKDCVHEQQKVFETAVWYDFPVAFFAAAIVIGVGSVLSSFIGFFIILVAVVAGNLATRVVDWAVRYRRSKYLWLAATAGGIAGCLPAIVPTLVMSLLYYGSVGTGGILSAGIGLLWPAAYGVMAVGSLIASQKGIRFF
jgi:hypothetical protein